MICKNKCFLGLLVFLFSIGLGLNISAKDSQNNQCYSNNTITDIDFNSGSDFKINADTLKRKNEFFDFKGNVLAHDNNQALHSELIHYNQKTGEMTTTFPSIYKQENLLARTKLPISLNSNTKQINALKTDFEIKSLNALATTSKIYSSQSNKSILNFEDIFYTHCQRDNPLWSIQASKGKINQETQKIEMVNTSINIAGIPIFWTPYISFSLENRASGLLFPEIKIKKFENQTRYIYTQPIYLNLAPNRDLTTSVIVDSIYGKFLSNQFRFLNKNNRGEINLHWLADGNKASNLNSREGWFLNSTFKSVINLNQPSHLSFILNRTSDQNYISKFTPFDRIETTRLLSSIHFSQSNAISDINLTLKDSQRLISNGDYYVKKNHLLTDFKPIKLTDDWLVDIKIDYSTFNRPDEINQSSIATGDRIYSELKLIKIFSKPGYLISPEIKLIDRRYLLNQNSLVRRDLSENHQFAIFKLDNKLFLERDFNSKMKQDLEIRALFVSAHVNETKQTTLPLFDSSLLKESSYLFLDNRFSGLDRQSHEKKVVFSATTSFFKRQNSQRKADFSIAQAYYFDPHDQYLDKKGNPKNRYNSDIYFLSSLYYNHFIFGASGQINGNADHKLDLKSYQISLRQNQFNPFYSFRYFEDSTYRFLNTSIQYQINKNHLSVNSTYSFKKDHTESVMLNLVRDDCCYRIGGSLSRIRKSDNLFENEIRFFFELKGLGNLRF